MGGGDLFSGAGAESRRISISCLRIDLIFDKMKTRLLTFSDQVLYASRAWLCAVVLVCAGARLPAQGLLPSASPPVPQLRLGAAAWADYNGDGRLDLFMCGLDSGGVRRSHLLRNTGTTLVVDTSQTLVQVAMGDAAWGDMDGDGDPDLVVLGEDAPRHGVTVVYENVGGVLVAVPGTGLPAMVTGRAQWSDMDGDGDADLVMAGYGVMTGFQGLVARNDGGSGWTLASEPLFSTREQVALGVGDYDGDGLPDIAYADISPQLEEGMRTVILHNGGGLSFQPVQHFLPGFFHGSLDFGDVDGDGDLDLLCAGMGVEAVTGVSKYGSGQFQAILPGVVTALGYGEARLADLNLDGILDMVSSGMGPTGPETRVYRGNNGTYTLIQGPGAMPSLYQSRMAGGDWNGDGHPDFVILGQGPDDLPGANVATWDPISEQFKF